MPSLARQTGVAGLNALDHIIVNYRHALRTVQESIDTLRADLSECETEPDVPYTPGRLAGVVAQLEAARTRASTLRDTLTALGVDVTEIQGA